MISVLQYDILKFTGKAGYNIPVNSISFKSVDTATYLDDRDSLNYPIFEPYLNDISLSYETWTKFKLKLNEEYVDNITSRGLTLEKEVDGVRYNITYIKIKNISFWFNTKPLSNIKINVGTTNSYSKPVNTESHIAVEDIITYYNGEKHFDDTVKFPIYFNGKSEILITQLNGAISDDFFVWQLQILSGLKYQLDQRVVGFKLHYELA